MLLCSIFVLIGIWLLNYTNKPGWIAWMNIGFFGLGYPVGFFHLLDRRPQIIINDIGIYDRTTNVETINWEIIEDAYLADIHGQKFICLVVDEAFEPSRKKSKWYQKTVNFNKSLGFQELNISLGQVQIDELELTEFILAMSNANKTKKDEKNKNFRTIVE